MKKNTLKNISAKTQGVFNIIPKEFRVTLAVAGLGYLGYKIYKKMNPDPEEQEEKQLEKEAASYKDAAGNTISCKGKLTLNESVYKSLANTLYDAFLYWGGTDEDSIYKVFNQMKTDCDVVQLIAAFGVRRKEFEFKDYDLPYFMRDELNDTEIRYVNQILSAKKITYRF